MTIDAHAAARACTHALRWRGAARHGLARVEAIMPTLSPSRLVRRMARPIALCTTLAASLLLAAACRSEEAVRAADTVLQQPAAAAAVLHKGINGNELHALSDVELQTAVAHYKALGVRWVRFDFDWSVIQPDNSQPYRLERFDTVVRRLSEAGISVLGILTYTPAWASGHKASKFFPPLDVADYAAFAGHMAAHFGPLGVHAWEIWNEPNLGQLWMPAPDPRAYAALLRAAYRAIHEADRDAIVVSGGLAQPGNSAGSMSALDFLQAIYDNGAGPYLDAVGNHPYMLPAMPGDEGPNNWRKMYAGSQSMRAVMARHDNGDKRIWITEFGAPTHGKDSYDTVITEDQQARMLAQAYRLVRTYSWAGPLFWYNLRDFCEYDTSKTAECYYGILRQDGTPKPAAQAYSAATQ
jgi:hypothetical protein